MFAIEYTSNRPAGSAPYYSLVIREEPYTVGCLPINDVCLPCHDVSPRHATFEVMRRKQALESTRANGNPDEIHSVHEEPIDPALQDPALGAPVVYAQRINHVGQVEAEEADEEDIDPNVAAAAAAAEGAETEAQSSAVVHADDGVVADGVSEAPPSGPAPLTEEDPLVVCLTALPSKGEGAIVVDGQELAPGESVILENGAEVQLCSEAAVVLRFRPLVVSIEATAFSSEYTRDLVYMFRRLGATLCNVISGPTPDLTSIPTPIGLLHCVEELNDSNGCVVALACGYSVVQPTYVFEWFAALAQSPSQPLSVLPAPSRFEVPVRATLHPRSTMYVRPESDTCPFSLYPIPSTAMRKRNRAELFYDRTFFLASPSSVEKYANTIAQCGGAVYGPADIEAVKDVLRDMVAAQPNPNLVLSAGQEERPYPAEFYVIVDNAAEATILNDGLRSADPELCQFMEEINGLGATHVPVLGDHSLFTSLLSNTFSYEPIQYSVDPPLVLPTVPAAASPNMIAYRAFSAGEVYQPYDDVSEMIASSSHIHRGQRSLLSPSRRSSMTRRSSASKLRASALPQNRGRTPSRSEMRSASRQRQRTASMGASEAGAETATQALSGRSASRGRRRLIPAEGVSPSGAPVTPLSVGDRFDILRIRVYAFLVREEPKLDTALVNFKRSYYVDEAVVQRSMETKAQAEDYMEQVDQLLDEGGYGPYTDSLRRFWRDCSDLADKAEKVLIAFGRQAEAPKPTSRRASSTYGSRTGSMSREGNDIFGGSVQDLEASSSSRAAPTPAPAAAPPALTAQDSSLSTTVASNGGAAGRSRPNTPRVREHRDAYLSLGGQRMSLSAGQARTQANGGVAPAARDSSFTQSTGYSSTPAAQPTQVADDSVLSSAAGEQQPIPPQHVDPAPPAAAATPTPTPNTAATRPSRHMPVQSDVQRRRQQSMDSPSLVRTNSRQGRRVIQGTSSADASLNTSGVQAEPRVRRAPPPKPYKTRTGSATNRRATPAKERPAWQV